MNTDSEHSAFEPRLPDDPAYWHGLAGRITESSASILDEYRQQQAWWSPFARWSPALGVAAVAAAITAIVMFPAREVAQAPAPVAFQGVLSPADPVAQAFVGGIAAPDVATLLILESGDQP